MPMMEHKSNSSKMMVQPRLKRQKPRQEHRERLKNRRKFRNLRWKEPRKKREELKRKKGRSKLKLMSYSDKRKSAKNKRRK